MARKKSFYPRFKSGLLVHRHVAAKMLGRRLRPGEEVHHKDRDTRNYSPDNLEVFPSRAAHRRHHREEDRRRAAQSVSAASSAKSGFIGFLKSLLG